MSKSAEITTTIPTPAGPDAAHGRGMVRLEPWRRLSHELRTPLHAILGHAEILLEGSFGPLGGEARKCVSEIQGAGRQLAHEFRRLLLIVEACGSPQREQEPIDCEAVFRTAFANRPVHLSWQGGPLVVRGEPFWLRALADACGDIVTTAWSHQVDPVAVVRVDGCALELTRSGCPITEDQIDAIALAVIEVVARRHGAEALWLPDNGLRIQGLRVNLAAHRTRAGD